MKSVFACDNSSLFWFPLATVIRNSREEEKKGKKKDDNPRF